MKNARVFDPRPCSLGEGPLWHPIRQEFFWFDINSHKLLSADNQEWQFDSYVSAAGWIDRSNMLIASDKALLSFDVDTGEHEHICPLEADIATTRSNDGRADPYGGFWIGTMPITEDSPSGAIYRYYRGELRKLYSGITIPNSICFSPDGLWAYWTDTGARPIMKQRLSERDGWPVGDPEVFTDPRSDGWNPDGSVVDAEGNLWNAQYGGFRVAGYKPDGTFIDAIDIPARCTTCPAFGGPDLSDMYVTSATQGLDPVTLAEHPLNGQTFVVENAPVGLQESAVIL